MPLSLGPTRQHQRRQPVALVRVDGQAYTYDQIVARLGKDRRAIQGRINQLRRAGKPVTWAALQAKPSV